MKAKTVSPAKKVVSPSKRGSSLAKKAIAQSKNSVSPTKIAATSRITPGLKNKVIHEIVMKVFHAKRIAYFVRDGERAKNGAFLLCVAVPGDGGGFIRFDCGWHCSYTEAIAKATEMNNLLRLLPGEIDNIITAALG